MISAFLFLLLARQDISREALQHAQTGIEAQKQGRLDAAIAEFRTVTELEPKLAAAFVNLGAVYLEKRDYGAAIPPLRRALELNPSLIGADQMLGYALLAQGYAAEAIPHLERAHDQEALGIAQLETGKLSEAIVNLQSAADKHPNDPDVLYYLGRACGLMSQQTFDALASAYPGSARAHQAAGESYWALRRVPEAEKEYHEALRLRPDTAGVHLALGEVYLGASELTKAELEFRAEEQLRPGSAESAYRLGGALLQEGKVGEARAQLERADGLKPGMPETLYSLGKAALLDGDTIAAEKAWTQVIAIEEGSPMAGQAHFALASLYRKQGKAAQAEHEMQQFRKSQSVATQQQNKN